MVTTIISHLLVGALGFAIGVFVYRNNKKDIDPLANKVDKIYDKLEKKDKILRQ